MKKLFSLLLIICLVYSLVGCGQNPPPDTDDGEQQNAKYELVVYGDTAAAVIAAVAASRQGIDAAIVAPNKQLGGMLSGGLSQTDRGNDTVIGGMSREFFSRVAQKKGKTDQVDWYFEPHVGEEILNDMIRETQATDHGIDVFLNERLVEDAGVVKQGATITKIICESGKTFEAEQFIDASYEGDLMAQAGVTYTYGREGSDVYGESLAGVVAPTTAGASNHNFKWNLKARDDQGNLKYEGINQEPLAPAGTGDKKIQAYNFRMVLTNDPENRIPFPCPDGYDASKYNLLRDYLNLWAEKKGTAPGVKDLFGFRNDLITSESNKAVGKFDFNNKGAVSTDFIGGNYNYPDGTYAQREQIWQDHYNYTAGLLYFLANDTQIPQATREAVAAYGLPADEYTETGNWTFQLYVREGRRMIGEYVMTQKDIQKNGGDNLLKDDTIGMGSYNSDSHNVQRYITEDGYVRNEGNMEVAVSPYEIPYRMILPKKAECDNLMVTCTFSASHVAYSTIRMEPQYMIIGEAAGTAAAIAIKDAKKVHNVNVAKLQIILSNGGAVLTTSSKPSTKQPDVLASDVVYIDSFDNWNDAWVHNYTGSSLKVLQNDSSASIQRGANSGYGYIARKQFVAPTQSFTLKFRAKLNSKSKAEISLRSETYLIRVVLTRGDGTSGTIQSDYVDTTKIYSLDTSVWHDYKVVVDIKSDGSFTYDMYVDGLLAWEDAIQTSGFKQGLEDIFKIGIDTSKKVGEETVVDFDVDYIMLQKGESTQDIRVISNIFKDSYGNKVTSVSTNNEISCGIFLENGSTSPQNVKIVVELYRNGSLLTGGTINNIVTIGGGEIKDFYTLIPLPADTTGLTVKVKVLGGAQYETVLVDNVQLGN